MQLKKIFCTKCAAFQILRTTLSTFDRKTGETTLKIACDVCTSRIMQLVVTDNEVIPAPLETQAPVTQPASSETQDAPPALSSPVLSEAVTMPPSPVSTEPSPSPESVQVAGADAGGIMSTMKPQHRKAILDFDEMKKIQEAAKIEASAKQTP